MLGFVKAQVSKVLDKILSSEEVKGVEELIKKALKQVLMLFFENALGLQGKRPMQTRSTVFSYKRGGRRQFLLWKKFCLK